MSVPTERVPRSVYSNFDCVIDNEVVELLKANPNRLYANHTAWDFQGNVWFDGHQWVEEVWRYHIRIDIRKGGDLLTLIESTNDEHGWA